MPHTGKPVSEKNSSRKPGDKARPAEEHFLVCHPQKGGYAGCARPRGTDEEVGTLLTTTLIEIEEGLLSGLAAKAELRELLDELYDNLE
jgi:hypothetical protein